RSRASAWAENRTSADASRSASTRRKSAPAVRGGCAGVVLGAPPGRRPARPFRDECPSRRPPPLRALPHFDDVKERKPPPVDDEHRQALLEPDGFHRPLHGAAGVRVEQNDGAPQKRRRL